MTRDVQGEFAIAARETCPVFFGGAQMFRRVRDEWRAC
jgi:hypothetical protein